MSLARVTPVTACTTIAGMVNNPSANTTSSETTRMAATLPLRPTAHLKNAVPRPVPNRTVDDVNELQPEVGVHVITSRMSRSRNGAKYSSTVSKPMHGIAPTGRDWPFDIF